LNSGKILMSTVFFLLMLACAYGVYSIANMVLSGIANKNWFLLIGGGILAYFFGFLLVIGAIAFFVLFVMSLTWRG
jgi:hypothetical protein